MSASSEKVAQLAREIYRDWLFSDHDRSPVEFFELAVRSGMDLATARPASMSGLTPRQRDLMLFIQGYVDSHGYSPSFEDMRAALGLASKSGIHRMVSALEERGLIQRPPGRSRSINVLARAA